MTFQEFEGTREVNDTIPNDVSSSYTKPLKLQKFNIGIDEHPKCNIPSVQLGYAMQKFLNCMKLNHIHK
jgi:hypothetical protein